jgi:hypothetical protein
MKNYFPKDITDCIRECLLAIFWRKQDIISFLKNNNCSSEDTQKADKEEHTRIQIIDITFEQLSAKNDAGIGQFRSMLRSIINWNAFDGYFFENGTLKKEEAIRKINHLKQLQELRDAKFKEKEVTSKKRQKEVEDQSNLANIGKIFHQLMQGKDETGKIIGNQKRGYLFEDFLKLIATKERLSGLVGETFSVQITGEQIDGRLKFEGENYILEAKWQDQDIASNALYHFAYKIEGKMLGRGVFISMSGFSNDSVSAVTQGKKPNMVLFDGGDMMLIAEGYFTFKEVLDIKVRAAQTKGLIYVDVNTECSKVAVH